MPKTEQEKIKLARKAFADFMAGIAKILERQREVLKSILAKADQQEIEKTRKNLEDIYDNKKF